MSYEFITVHNVEILDLMHLDIELYIILIGSI
jgi:hypothetical protein